MRAALPAYEGERQLALERYQILDTPAEAAYDDLVKLAGAVCGTPASALSLIDRDRQWFKSRVGFELAETERSSSFCAHAILNPRAPLVVEDARLDPRFQDNPFVIGEPGIRFYAAVPILSSEGLPLGALCVSASEPLRLSDDQLAALSALARQIEAQLELRLALDLLRNQSRELQQSLATEERIMSRQREALACLSRDIRTQMNGVVGLADVLRQSSLDSRQREYLDAIVGSAEALMASVSLGISSLEMRNGSSEPVSVDRILQDAVALVRPSAMARRVRMSVRTEPTVANLQFSGERQVRSLVVAFVRDAVAGAGPRGITLAVDIDGGLVVFSAGPLSKPIAPDLEADLVHAASLVGGSFRQSAGRLARLTIPLLTRSPRILVVGDDNVDRFVLSSLLEEKGCQVICAATAEAADQMLDQEEYDLVFVEEEFENQLRWRHPRAILVTSQSPTTTDPDLLLLKPLSAEKLGANLGRWLAR